MRQKATLLILFTVSLLALSAAALDVSRGGSDHSTGAGTGDPCARPSALHEEESHSHDAAASTSLAHADQTAISEMHAFARDHFNDPKEHPKTFGAARHWAPDWELRWIDYGVSGTSIRVYHLSSRHDPAIRYLSIEDHGHGHAVTWQPIH